MIDPTNFFVQQLINRLSSDSTSAQARIRAARTMRHVKHAADVQANSIIRALPQVRQELRRVHDCAEARMVELLNQQLASLRQYQSSELLRAEHSRLVRNDWCFLRGAFSSVYMRADREYQRLLHVVVQRESPSSVAPSESEPQFDNDEGEAPSP
jgi:hypothetical protein